MTSSIHCGTDYRQKLDFVFNRTLCFERQTDKWMDGHYHAYRPATQSLKYRGSIRPCTACREKNDCTCTVTCMHSPQCMYTLRFKPSNVSWAQVMPFGYSTCTVDFYTTHNVWPNRASVLKRGDCYNYMSAGWKFGVFCDLPWKTFPTGVPPRFQTGSTSVSEEV